MKLRKQELIVIGLTLAFAFFTIGFLVGRRGSVNIVTVEPRQPEQRAADTSFNPPAQIETPALPQAESPLESPDVQTEDVYNEAVPDHAEEPYTDANGLLPEPGYANGQEPGQDDDPIPGAPRGGNHRIININTASRAELTDLTGIGDVLAGRIIEYRDRTGGFSRIEDIMNVSGIGQARFDAIRDRITV